LGCEAYHEIGTSPLFLVFSNEGVWTFRGARQHASADPRGRHSESVAVRRDRDCRL